MRHILWVDDKYATENENASEEVRIDPHEEEIKHFKSGGIEVDTVGSTDSAIDALSRNGVDHYSGIITDMERGDDETAGIKIWEHVRGGGHDLPVFIYTTGKHTKQKYDGIREDPSAYIVNATLVLFEHVSREVLEDEDILLRKDPENPDSDKKQGRINRFVYSDQAFFQDDAVQDQMDKRRPAIEVVRDGWDDTEKLLTQILRLPSFIDESAFRVSLIDYAAKISGDTYKWDDSDSPDAAISLLPDYTSRAVYDTVYGIMNGRIYRVRDKAIGFGDLLLATYILEHINIALFHHVAQKGDFGEGSDGQRKHAYPIYRPDTTYRGIQIKRDQLSELKKLVAGDEGRTFSHPLSLVSSSRSIAQASTFLADEATQSEKEPALFKTYILSLPADYLRLYNKYSSSTISSICAVDIQDQSYYADEEEVLFRGPFFEMLDYLVPEESERAEADYQQFNAVTIDVNRDHPSTYAMKDDAPVDVNGNYTEGEEPKKWKDLDDQVRYLFGRIVMHWRFKACKAYHKIHNPEDKELLSHYDALIEAREKDVHKHFNETIPSVEVPTSIFE